LGHSVMRRLSIAVLGVVILGLNPQLVRAQSAQKTLALGYCPVEGFIEAENQGVGVSLMDAVLERLVKRGFKIETSLKPCARVLAEYQAGKLDLAYPIISDGAAATGGYKKWGFNKVPYYSSPLYVGGDFITYTRTDDPLIHDTDGLKGRLTGIIAGAFVPPETKSPQPSLIIG